MAKDEHTVDKAEPAEVREKRLAEEEKRRKAEELEREADENDISAKAGYVFFKNRDLQLLKTDVIVHPTVLLSVSDHYTRSAKDTNRRVVGVLLGETHNRSLHITNTFGVPFEEDNKDPKVWYLDHSHLEKMYLMFKKINAKENIAGWYSTSSHIKEADVDIHELIRKYCPNPLFLLVDVHCTETHKLPIQTYFAFEQPAKEEQFRRSFVHVACRIGATEAEEVGVEHLLRDFQGASTSTLTSMIQDKLTALKQLAEKLHEIANYLDDVAHEKYPVQPHLLTQFQRLLNALPDKTDAEGFKDAFQLATNDSLLASYVAFATRLVLQVNELVRFKLSKRVGEINKALNEGQQNKEAEAKKVTDEAKATDAEKDTSKDSKDTTSKDTSKKPSN